MAGTRAHTSVIERSGWGRGVACLLFP